MMTKCAKWSLLFKANRCILPREQRDADNCYHYFGYIQPHSPMRKLLLKKRPLVLKNTLFYPVPPTSFSNIPKQTKENLQQNFEIRIRLNFEKIPNLSR